MAVILAVMTSSNVNKTALAQSDFDNLFKPFVASVWFKLESVTLHKVIKSQILKKPIISEYSSLKLETIVLVMVLLLRHNVIFFISRGDFEDFFN